MASDTTGAATTTYEATARTTPTRHRDRASYQAAAIHAVLDEALFCHVGYVVDGEPVVVPTIHARLGEVLYLHASSGARLARLGAAGDVPLAVTVTLLDGLVLARSHFNHSMNYRSVAVRGMASLVGDDAERRRALAVLVEHVAPGRSVGSRPPTSRELAATSVLRLPLAEAVLKTRSGPPKDDGADVALEHWGGVVPVHAAFGAPLPAPDLSPGIEVPTYVQKYRRS